ncbi:MAG: LacI family DNA-binding transcriptional regulator [Planctomycetaceae bacterium]|nr:LacI family DNA-binding transcriptional regulator [Planctomycetaceae bacterium]
MKPTIKIIAAYAGVSRGVVDRVLHGRPNVNPEKRRRVEAALRDLDYTPDRAARALALKNKGMKIAVVMPVWSGSFG